MSFRVDRYRVELSREARRFLTIHDTMAFVEDGDFLREFMECDLTADDRDLLEAVITVFPDGGEVVPVSKNVRDAIYCVNPENPVIIRYVYLKPSTVLLLQAYPGEDILPMTEGEAALAETYISHQLEYFSRRNTR